MPTLHLLLIFHTLLYFDLGYKNQFSLIISLDCGIRAIENIYQAKQLGIDFIVCDHHTPGDQLPEAIAILDPKRKDCGYPYKELTGCGIGFKLLQAFCDKGNHNSSELYQYLDYVVISIAADIVPITGENRTLSYLGLNVLRKTTKPGLKSLMEISGVKSHIDISKVVFGLAPRINAAGRINHARDSVNLLISDKEQANAFAIKLNKLNQERKNFDKSATEEALSMIDENPDLVKAKSTLLHNPNWHKGVIGIVASRCIEKYYRPTIICTTSENKITGSARSVPGFDIYDAILNCEEFLEQFGGHKYAAGLSLSENKFENFKNKFEKIVAARITLEQLIPKIKIDTLLDFNYITYKFYNILKQMGPFGPGNSTPIFVTREVTAASNGRLMKKSHIKIFVKQSGVSNKFEAIGFNLGKYFNRIQNGENFSMAYSIQEASYKDSQYLQLNIRDIKFSGDHQDAA